MDKNTLKPRFTKTGRKMKELNHKILKNSLQQLPEYAPPPAIWDALEENLDADATLNAGLQRLPQYEPPSEIWTQIETQLAAGHPVRVVHSRRLHAGWYAAAAALALLLAGWWWWQLPEKESHATAIAVTQEVVDEQLLHMNTESEDDAFQLVQELCRSQVPVCQQPGFKTLKSELDELTEAKSELRHALGAFGDDPELHAQLARIERERSEVLRQMMAMI